jgi:hypothetical protein
MVSQTAKGVASVPVHAIQKLFGKKKPADSEKNPDDSKSK